MCINLTIKLIKYVYMLLLSHDIAANNINIWNENIYTNKKKSLHEHKQNK